MIAHILATVALLTGTMTDFHRREVPYWVTSGLIFIAAIIAILQSIQLLSFTPVLESALGFGVAWALGSLMYYTGQWGGADTTLLMGLGALFGLPLALEASFFSVFMFVALFAGAAYGVLYLFVLVLIKRKTVFPEIRKRLEQPFINKIRKICLPTILLVFVLAVFMTNIITVMLAFIGGAAYFTFLLYHMTKAVEQTAFIKQIAVKDLVEGDWVCEDVTKAKKTILKEEDLTTGLEKKHIELLKKHKVQTVTVKEGIPFIPSFLLAYVATIYLYEPITSFFSLVF